MSEIQPFIEMENLEGMAILLENEDEAALKIREHLVESPSTTVFDIAKRFVEMIDTVEDPDLVKKCRAGLLRTISRTVDPDGSAYYSHEFSVLARTLGLNAENTASVLVGYHPNPSL